MEFITKEQFLGQPKKVQDIFKNEYAGKKIMFYGSSGNKHYKIYQHKIYLGNGKFEEKNNIPALTEGQLRHFIEDKTGCKIASNLGKYGYQITLYKFEEDDSDEEYLIEYFDDFSSIDLDTHDLLQAYWQVAIQIAKENINK